MDPDDTTPISGDNAADSVTVVVDVPAADTEDQEATVVVIEDSSADDAVEAVVVEQAIDSAVAIAELQAEVERLNQRVFDAEMKASEAAFVAEEAIDMTAEVEVETEALNAEFLDVEGELEEAEDAIEPESAKVHGLFRSWSEWRGR